MQPLPHSPLYENPDPQPQEEQPSFPVFAESRAHVLIVEDDPPMVRVIAAALTEIYRVTTARDGQEGLEQALALHPDLILCDVSMPRMSGEQLVMGLRARPDFADVPIVVLSGRTDTQLRLQLLGAGAQDYLLKPFHPEELRMRVANLLMMRQVRQILQQEVMQQGQSLADLANEVAVRKRENEQMALEESETNFRFLTDSMPQIVWTARADGQLDYCNQRWFDYTATTYEQPRSWGLTLHPDDLQKCRDAWSRVMQAGKAFEIEYRLKRASDGAYRWHLGRALPVQDSNGKIIKWLGTSTDIDDQKQAEEALRTSEARLQVALRDAKTHYAQLQRTKSQMRSIIDASQEAMLFLSPDGRPIKVNTRFTDFFGLDATTVLSQSSDQLTARLKDQFVDASSLDRLLALSAADQEHVFQEPQVQAKPARREFAFSSLPVINVDSTYMGRLYVWRDMTHERAVDRMKSEFVSLASHELRTPLTSIKGYIDLLLTDESVGELAELQREFLEVAQNNARRLVSLIDDLLDLSHMESGKLALQREPLNVNLLISELIPSFQPGWDARRQTFLMHLPEEAPMALGDADRVTQILTNLLSNAHKYTPEEGRIDLSVEAAGPMARIAISDSGIGLSAEEQAQLFTPFYRVHRAATAAVGGTGLGLAITRSLVEMQGGEISVSSEPGHGSTFCFTLPLADRRGLPTLPGKTPPGKRILAVNAEPDIWHLLHHYLQAPATRWRLPPPL